MFQIFYFLIGFVILNILETIFIFSFKKLANGLIIGIMEAIEFPIFVYLLLTKSIPIFLFVISLEVSQLLAIAYFLTKS